MKNIWGKVLKVGAAVAALATTICIFLEVKADRAKSVLACNRGESFVDTAVKILIAIVIGALVLAGLYLLFNVTIMPTLTERIQNMFNYSGS